MAPVFAQPHKQKRDIFAKSLQGKEPSEYLTNLEDWRARQKHDVETAIAALPAQTKAALTQEAAAAIKYTWPALPVSQYLEFRQNGNRIRYETSLKERRARLSSLVIGELIDRQGKYLPQIANGLWATLEESTWVLPAHISVQKAGIGLPDPSEVIIDLVSGETSSLVAWTYLLLHDDLGLYSPMIPKRMLFELNRRTVEPYITRDYWWMGFGGGTVNNWDIWINKNVLETALLTVNDKQTLDKLVVKAMRSADQFVN